MNKNRRNKLKRLPRSIVSITFGLTIAMNCVLLSSRACCTQEPAVEQADENVDAIVSLIRQLDANEFDRRETASRKLIEIGELAIPLIAEFLPQESAEAKLRCIYVLQTMALADSVSLHSAAAESLEQLQASDDPSVATKAMTAMKFVSESRERVALARLKELGAEIQMVPVVLNRQIVPQPWSIRIGKEWKGTNEDLERLNWVSSIRGLELDGKVFDDESIAKIKLVPQLYTVALKRCQITDAGLRALTEMENLSTISIHYCAVTDASIETLRKIEYASLFKLYGTKITREAAMSLKEDGVEVDFRRGALLGVACLVGSDRCQISTVEPESAAEKAGIHVGDVVYEFDGVPVANINELTAAVSKFEPGDESIVKWYRSGEAMEATIKLGSW